jgi:signal transduction histidine kinase
VADFLSALVHELRTPLTALRGALGLLVADAADGNDAAREFGDIAARNALKLAALLDDVAAYARLKNPDSHVTPRRIDLQSVFEQAAEKVQPAAAERGVTVLAHVPTCDAVADEALLRDAVARMLHYAVRVTPREGTVAVSAETVSGRVVVRVIDQGRALAEEDQPSVFEPFSQVARRGVDSADRAALDLAIARLVAERHDGSIEYRQITGGGVVRLTLGGEE